MTAHLRFYRRVRLCKGVTLNLGKRGVNSVSFGGRGAHFTVGRDGTRATLGLPGSGLYLTEQQKWRERAPTLANSSNGPQGPQAPSNDDIFLRAALCFIIFAAGLIMAFWGHP